MARKRTPTTFTSLLVSDRKDPVVHTSNPRPSESVAVVAEIQSDRGALLVSRLPTTILDALKNDGQAVNGMIAYDETKKNFVLYQGDEWISVTKAGLKEFYIDGPESSEEGDMMAFAADLEKTFKSRSTSRGSEEGLDSDPVPVPVHYVKGPVSSNPGNLAVFNNSTGSEVADSGLNVQKGLMRLQREDNLEAQEVIQLRNLGELQFVNGLGVILVDDLIPVTWHTRGAGAETQVCTVFSGDFVGESSSPSALVKINATTGALLVSRLTTSQRETLQDPQNGMIVYDIDAEAFFFYQQEDWVALETGSGGQGDVKGPDLAVIGEIPLFDSTLGKKIGNSGMVLGEEKRLTGLGSLRLDTPNAGKKYSIWATSTIVALDYYVLSSKKFKNILKRGESAQQDAHDLFSQLSFVKYKRHEKMDAQQDPHFGLIAEEVAEIAPHLVKHHEEGIALNKGALLDTAMVVLQKLMKDKEHLTQRVQKLEQKLEFFFSSYNNRAVKNNLRPFVFKEEEETEGE
jgi:hypothetical protein